MRAVISLLIEKKTGALARLACALPQFGLSFDRHRIYGCTPDRCHVDIVADDCSNILVDELYVRLPDVDGVLEVLDIRIGKRGADEDVKTFEVSTDDSWVNEIAWSYPYIQSLVEEFEDKLAPQEREHRLTKLGVQVGTRIGIVHPQLAEAGSVDTALRTAVLPALQSIAVGKADESNVKITSSIFLRQNLDMIYMPIGDEYRGCFFLTGLILGMLNQAPQLPRLNVVETRCQELGYPFCYFKIDKA